MPTAVERLANFLRNSLSLDVGDGSVDQAFFNRIDAQVDPGLTALNSATSARQFAAADRQYGGAFEALGAGAVDIGFHLERNAFEGLIIGGALERSDIFTGQGGGSGVPADFSAFEGQLFKTGGDLVAFGADLARLGRVGSHEALVAVENRLHRELQGLTDDFVTLGRDTGQLASDIWTGQGGGSGTVESGAGGPVEALASALNVLGASFGSAGAHFAALNTDLTGGGAVTANAAVLSGGGKPGADFASLHGDFVSISSGFQGLAAPLANLLLPAVTPAPGVA